VHAQVVVEDPQESKRETLNSPPRRSLQALLQFVGRGWHDADGVTALDGVGWGVVVASGAGAAYAEQHPNVGWSARSLSRATPVYALALRNGSVAELGSPSIQCAADSGLCSHAVDEPSAHTHPLVRVAQALPALRAPIQYH